MIRNGIILFAFLFALLSSSEGQTEYNIGDSVQIAGIDSIIKKRKALILDFWAPWCSPCITSFPKLDSLQKEFRENLQVVLVTRDDDQYAGRVLSNFNKLKNMNLTSITEDSVLSVLFNVKILPHYVWIDAKGVIRAITGSQEINRENLNKLLMGENLNLPVKNDQFLEIDFGRPFFINNQKYEQDVAYQSVLVKYTQGLRTLSTMNRNFILCTNHPILLLYKMAFGYFNAGFVNNNRVVLENFDLSDSLMIGRYTRSTRHLWREIKYDNMYSYEFLVKDSSFSQKNMAETMQADLNRYFGVKGFMAKREKRKSTSYALIRTSAADRLKTKGGSQKDKSSEYYLDLRNIPLSAFISKLTTFFYEEGSLPVIDETGYTGNVDMEINADLTDIKAVNKELKKYDLKLVQKEKELDMIVITKKRKDK